MYATAKIFLPLCLLLAAGTPLCAQTRSLDRYSFSEKHAIVRELSRNLKEISGLAVSSQGQLYAHNDEQGRIFVLDALTGSQLRHFDLGDGGVREDFEGIAVAGKRIWLVTSGGDLYEFGDPGEGKNAGFTKYCTALDRDNDVEGLCYDQSTNELLLACKGLSGTGNRGDKAVYAFSIKHKTFRNKPRFVLSGKQLRNISGKGDCGFSGIERHPGSGHFLLLSSKSFCIIEVSAKGEVIGSVSLPKKLHPQPEGIAMLPGGELLISDEGKKTGRLTLYRSTAR